MANAQASSEAAVLAAFRHLPVPTLVVEHEGAGGTTVLAASETAVALLGRELEGRRLDEVLPAPGAGPLLDVREAPLPGERPLAVVQLLDVSGAAETERSLRESIRTLQDIVDNSAALIYVKDTDGRYVLVNRHFERRFGLRTDEVLGRRDHELFPAEAAARYVEHDREVLATAQAMEVEEPAMEVEDPALEVHGSWLSIKFPLLDEAGRPYALGGISTDITDRKRAEAAAREARDEAERANRAKSEFLSRMSHELRTPLNAILGFGQLLQLDGLPADAQASVERILKAGRHLLALINEVLEITRIEAGAHNMTVESVHACDPLNEALELVRPLARERRIELASDMHGGLERHVSADFQRLKQVLLNLLTNAVKYNREGGVVRAFFKPGDDGRLRFLVTDTGPGMDEQERARVFLPFERLTADGGETEGTGLGLALSKSLVEAMGGRIGVQHSEPGEGSTFFVELPLADPDAAATDPADREYEAARLDGPPLGPATILYVEDNLSNFELVQRILARVGDVDLIPAMQGALGLELAAQHHPDLVLLDLHLPDIAGDEVLRRLKRDRRTRDIPVLMLSADATPAQIERLGGEGVVAYITKPLDITRFVDAVRAALA